MRREKTALTFSYAFFMQRRNGSMTKITKVTGKELSFTSGIGVSSEALAGAFLNVRAHFSGTGRNNGGTETAGSSGGRCCKRHGDSHPLVVVSDNGGC